ncbi:MAG: dTMP kinase [Gammaproteobacteria bacterium]|nr:MAG: dTMP kinase [Gammaproteobacteria bacterium]RLA54954.1 MAG: dTMP kinase [Gammaproteobacteria bacterium]
MRGKFITVEGTEGVGKSTNISCIEQWLSSKGIEFITSREPGGTELGEEIRGLLLGHRSTPVDDMAELLLVFSARAQHLSEKILPALNKGIWVLCDRFTDATFAYQGSGRGLDTGLINTLAEMVQKQLQPDLTLMLDIDPEIGLARVDGRGERDRFESQEIAFFERVRQGYRKQIARQPARFRVIDASQTQKQVAQDVRMALDEFAARC